MNVRLESSWLNLLKDQFEQPYFQKLKQAIQTDKKAGVQVFPPGSLIFAAMDRCPVDKTKVVLLGQDPYHNPGQAHGLCFSVPPGIPIPPSLINIYKELEEDLGIQAPSHGNLESWTDQGILLLNTSLTVRAYQAGSHFKLGWEQFTDTLISRLSTEKKHLVFILWGRPARSKKALINPQQGHLILEAAHPSPLSAYKGFFGCRHFSQTNRFLEAHNQTPINWQLQD